MICDLVTRLRHFIFDFTFGRTQAQPGDAWGAGAPPGPLKTFFIRNFVGMGVNLVRCSPLGEIKISKHTERVTTKEVIRVFMKNGVHPAGLRLCGRKNLFT